MVYVDELFVKESYRSKWISTKFFKYLEQNDTICLETIWQNKKAQRFYEKNNFSIYENIFYFKKLN